MQLGACIRLEQLTGALAAVLDVNRKIAAKKQVEQNSRREERPRLAELSDDITNDFLQDS
jgi:hypothetical protein